jgi:hypothetical protein
MENAHRLGEKFKLIRCRSFFKYMLLHGTFGPVRRKSYVESATRI